MPIERIDPQFLRQVVADPTGEQAGTIVVDTSQHFPSPPPPPPPPPHLVLGGGQAMRYGVGLGRQGFEWAGRANVQWKQKWPKWTPPADMIARQPELAKYSVDNGGMPPGLDNPSSARVPSISSRTARTRSTACTARRSGTRSAGPFRQAASA